MRIPHAATKKSNESIDEKAFQALEAALKIDFDELKSSPNDKTLAQIIRRKMCLISLIRLLSPITSRNAKPQQEAPAPREQMTPHAGSAPNLRPKSPPFLRQTTMGAALRLPCCAPSTFARTAPPSVSQPSFPGDLGRGRHRCRQPALWAPQIWQIRSLSISAATPGAVGVAIGIALPIMLFFSFAIMIARAQELRNAARAPWPKWHCAWPNRKLRPPTGSRPSVRAGSPRSLGDERRHRAHDCARHRTRNAGSLRGECARAQLQRKRTARACRWFKELGLERDIHHPGYSERHPLDPSPVRMAS